MAKKYSFFGAGLSRIHPIAVPGVVAFLLAFLTHGLIKMACIIIFLIMLAFYALSAHNIIKD